MRLFDKKFGKEFIAELPTTPAVYRIFDKDGFLIYIGKARNLRRRIGQYRNAKRRKAHLKMRKIINEAVRLEFESCSSDMEACLLEAKLIQEHRPRWNTAGAFYFLYPLVGVKFERDITYFCYTTEPESFDGFDFHGAYRSRGLVRAAFWSLVELLGYVGHRTSRNRSFKLPKHSYVVGFRRLPEEWMPLWQQFLKGESRKVMEELILAMVENAGARRAGREIQTELNRLKAFWKHEALSLKTVCEAMSYTTYPVPQKERDFLYLKRRFLNTVPGKTRKDASAPGPTPNPN